MTIGFGAQLKAGQAPAEQWETVRAIERAGYDSVWTGDHVSFHHPLYESLTLLASYASITSRIKLGTGVYRWRCGPPRSRPRSRPRSTSCPADG
jgi:alkanesulfonate monooxygenase SsuD/methylene tetrahydromethanopterin reductase-like flavin-dependent oxidoreductase (luciferase family)